MHNVLSMVDDVDYPGSFREYYLEKFVESFLSYVETDCPHNEKIVRFCLKHARDRILEERLSVLINLAKQESKRMHRWVVLNLVSAFEQAIDGFANDYSRDAGNLKAAFRAKPELFGWPNELSLDGYILSRPMDEAARAILKARYEGTPLIYGFCTGVDPNAVVVAISADGSHQWQWNTMRTRAKYDFGEHSTVPARKAYEDVYGKNGYRLNWVDRPADHRGLNRAMQQWFAHQEAQK